MCTPIAGRAGARLSDRGKKATESLEGAFRQQPRTMRMTSSTALVDLAPSPPEASPDTPRLPQRAQETMQSLAATGSGSPLTLSLRGSRIPVGECSTPSPPLLPQQQPTTARPTTGASLLTPGMVLTLESSTNSTDRPAQSTMPRSCQPTSALTPGGRSSGSAPTSELPPSPPQPPPQTPAESGQPQEETCEDCCVCHEALVAPMVCLRSCPHRLHLLCYAAL